MKLHRPVIVLGAGASAGAKLHGGRTPPLDAGFFEAAERVFRGKRAVGRNLLKVRAWKKFQTELKGAGLEFKDVKTWRLEQLSTYLEARANLRVQLGSGRPRDFQEALDALKVLVCHVLESEGGAEPCSLHRDMFAWLNPSGVISFNYDIIADQTLLDLQRLEWRSALYRGGVHAHVPDKSRTKRVLVPRRVRGLDTVPLLKLHGSMHWEAQGRGTGHRLAGCHLPLDGHGFSYERVPRNPYIVPPVASKIQIAQPELGKQWKAAVKLLKDAPSWVIWGYSFPPTDTIAHVLFRTALARHRKAKPVLVLNPDSGVAGRVKDVCRKVRVERYGSVERFLLDEQRLAIAQE